MVPAIGIISGFPVAELIMSTSMAACICMLGKCGPVQKQNRRRWMSVGKNYKEDSLEGTRQGCLLIGRPIRKNSVLITGSRAIAVVSIVFYGTI